MGRGNQQDNLLYSKNPSRSLINDQTDKQIFESIIYAGGSILEYLQFDKSGFKQTDLDSVHLNSSGFTNFGHNLAKFANQRLFVDPETDWGGNDLFQVKNFESYPDDLSGLITDQQKTGFREDNQSSLLLEKQLLKNGQAQPSSTLVVFNSLSDTDTRQGIVFSYHVDGKTEDWKDPLIRDSEYSGSVIDGRTEKGVQLKNDGPIQKSVGTIKGIAHPQFHDKDLIARKAFVPAEALRFIEYMYQGSWYYQTDPETNQAHLLYQTVARRVVGRVRCFDHLEISKLYNPQIKTVDANLVQRF